VAMLAKNFRRLMKDDRFKKKFSERVKKSPREAELEEEEKKDPRGPRYLNAQALGISRPIAGILKRARGKYTM
jgi:hypothetical protein